MKKEKAARAELEEARKKLKIAREIADAERLQCLKNKDHEMYCAVAQKLQTAQEKFQVAVEKWNLFKFRHFPEFRTSVLSVRGELQAAREVLKTLRTKYFLQKKEVFRIKDRLNDLLEEE